MNKEYTYDQVPNISLLVKFIISIRELYAACTTIVIMCHNKDPDHPGMEWMPGAVEQVLIRCQLTINEKYGLGGRTTNNDEVWGILYPDAKTTPGWDNNDHPSVWLQPIPRMAARLLSKGKTTSLPPTATRSQQRLRT